jgi:hypothetical protein
MSRRIVKPQQEISDAGKAEHQVRRFAGAEDPTGPRQPVILELLNPANADRLGLAAQLGPAQEVGGQDQQVSIAAVTMAQ